MELVVYRFVYMENNSTVFNFQPLIWKMKPPEKKPLIRVEKVQEAKAKVRRSSQKKPASALKILSDFSL